MPGNLSGYAYSRAPTVFTSLLHGSVVSPAKLRALWPYLTQNGLQQRKAMSHLEVWPLARPLSTRSTSRRSRRPCSSQTPLKCRLEQSAAMRRRGSAQPAPSCGRGGRRRARAPTALVGTMVQRLCRRYLDEHGGMSLMRHVPITRGSRCYGLAAADRGSSRPMMVVRAPPRVRTP